MLIAIIENNEIKQIGQEKDLFPNISFPFSGVDDEFMIQNSCMYVLTSKPYDFNTQKLVSVPPYFDNVDDLHWVCTVVVEDLTPEEIEQRNQFLRQTNKIKAKQLLAETDWTATMDVSNPEYRNPYLENQDDFLFYRNDLFKIVLNPPIVVEAWPTKPSENWVTV